MAGDWLSRAVPVPDPQAAPVDDGPNSTPPQDNGSGDWMSRATPVDPDADLAALQAAHAPADKTDDWLTVVGKTLKHAPVSLDTSLADAARGMIEVGDPSNIDRDRQNFTTDLNKLQDEKLTGAIDGGLNTLDQVGLVGKQAFDEAAYAMNKLPSAYARTLDPTAAQDIGNWTNKVNDAKKFDAPKTGDSLSAKSLFYGGGQGLITAVPLVAGAIVTKNPAVALGPMMAQAGGSSYGEQRAAGNDPYESALASSGVAAAQGAGEALPLGTLMKTEVGSIFSRVGKSAIKGAIGQGATQLITDGINKGTIDPKMTLEDAVKSVGGATLIGAGTDAAIGAVTHPMHGADATDPDADLSNLANKYGAGGNTPPPSGGGVQGTWKSGEYDYPVTILNEPANLGNDGQYYQNVQLGDKTQAVPVSELLGPDGQPHNPVRSVSGQVLPPPPKQPLLTDQSTPQGPIIQGDETSGPTINAESERQVLANRGLPAPAPSDTFSTDAAGNTTQLSQSDAIAQAAAAKAQADLGLTPDVIAAQARNAAAAETPATPETQEVPPQPNEAPNGDVPQQLQPADNQTPDEIQAQAIEAAKAEEVAPPAQTTIPGTEEAPQRVLAERGMEGRQRAEVAQKAPGEDGGLFDEGQRKQQDLLDAMPKGKEAEAAMATLERAHDALPENDPRRDVIKGQMADLVDRAVQPNKPIRPADRRAVKAAKDIIKKESNPESESAPQKPSVVEPKPVAESKPSQKIADQKKYPGLTMPDIPSSDLAGLYRSRKKIEKAFAEDSKTQAMPDDQFETLENYGRDLESEIAKREKAGESAIPAGKPKAEAEPGKVTLSAIREHREAESGASLPKRPLMSILKKLGGIDPSSPIAEEMKHIGVNPRSAPGLFRKGGRKNLDNIPHSEHELLRDNLPDDGNGYTDQKAILDAMRDEVAGKPLRTAAEQESMSANHDPDFERLLHESGVNDSDSHPFALQKVKKYLAGKTKRINSDEGDIPFSATRKGEYPTAPRDEWYGDADYKARGAPMIEMSPDDYLSQVRPLDIDESSRDNIDDLKNHIQSGGKLDPLAIYADGKEDGRHRAHAAKELGIDKVPVIDFRNQKDQYSATTQKAAATHIDKIKSDIAAIAKKMNPTAKLEMFDEIIGSGKGLEAHGLGTGPHEVAGAYNRLEKLISVSTNTGKFDPYDTTFHELWHSLEGVMTPEEQKLLRNVFPAKTDAMHREKAAIAFAKWANDKRAGEPVSRLHKVFAKVKGFLNQVGDYFKKNKIASVDDIYKKAYKGELGKRAVKSEKEEFTASRKAVDDEEPESYSVSNKQVAKDHEDELKIIDGKMDSPKHQSIPERIRDIYDNIRATNKTMLRRAFFDDLAAIHDKEIDSFGKLRDASVSAYKAARLTRGTPAVFQAVVGQKIGKKFMGGQVRWNNGSVEIIPGSKPLMHILDPILSQGPEMSKLFQGYVIANRAKRLIAEGRENLLTQPEIDKLLPLGDKYPEFKKALAEYQVFNKSMLDFAEHSGLVNKEQRALFAQNDYVPFYRVMEDDKTAGQWGGGRKIEGQRSGIKTLKGGTERLGNIFESMAQNASKMIDASIKNDAMRRTDQLYDGSDALSKLPPKWEPVKLSASEVADKLFDLGVDVNSMSQAQKDEYLTFFKMGQPRDKGVISFMDGGKPVYRRVNDPMLLSAVQGLGPERMSMAMNLLNYPSRLLTATVTRLPAAFAVRNLLRDTLSSAIGLDTARSHIPDVLKGYAKAYTMHQSHEDMLAGGGGISGYYSKNIKQISRSIHVAHDSAGGKILEGAHDLYEHYERLLNASEQANRQAIYDHVLRQGGTKAEASYQARDLLDFSMKGSFAPWVFLTKTLPFLNARAQGLYKLGREAKDNPRRVLLRGGILMAATLALAAQNNNDPRYTDLSEFDKDNYYHFWLGDHHFRMVKPFEIGALFSTIPERLFFNKHAFGDDRDATTLKSFASTIYNTFGFDPTMPQIIKPLEEDYANKDSFTGAKIVSQKDDNDLPESQYGPNTPYTARMISQGLPGWAPDIMRSPARMQHLLDGYLGGLPTYMMAASDSILTAAGIAPAKPTVHADDMPVIGTFFRNDPGRATKWLSSFYDLKQQSDQVAATVKKYQKQGDGAGAARVMKDNLPLMAVHGKLTSINTQLRGINAQMNQIRSAPGMTGDQKQKALDTLGIQRNRVVKQIEPLFHVIDGDTPKAAPAPSTQKPIGPLSYNHPIAKEAIRLSSLPAMKMLLAATSSGKGTVQKYQSVLQNGGSNVG